MGLQPFEGSLIRRRQTILLFLVTPSLVALDCATEIASVTDEPHHHLVLTTPRVRVFDVRLAPREYTALFAHLNRGVLYMDNLNINLGATNINLVPQAGGTPCEYPRRLCRPGAHRLALRDGDVWFRSIDDGVEMIDNDSGPAYHSVAIDFTNRSTSVVPCDTACVDPTNASITRVMTADQWVVSSVILPPSGRVDVHDAVTVAVSTVDLAYNGSLARGDPGTVHRVHGTITNVGSRGARLILLEFLPIHVGFVQE
ncbi:MAG TPA: hypothetical protein VK807_21955 [Gemmatimonadaceae bacterium]|nr:hypothetical protein [Gemmatimonadaceae bacterium]